jgi:thymidylate synthase (FAD)
MKVAEMEVRLLDYMGTDLSVVNAARVSFAKASEWEPIVEGCEGIPGNLSEKDKKLVNYLARHNHWTPFAHTAATFFVKAPMFVARQLGKHQVGLVWNEVSRRYVDDEPEFWFPKEWRGKPVNAKQGSAGVLDMGEESDGFDHAMWFEGVVGDCLQWYNEQIERGMAPEQARMVLPQNTMTEWWWTGSVAAWARVCKLRLDPHAQQETGEIASYIRNYLVDKFPVSFNALMEN